MRNAQDRSDAYAEQKVRDADDGTHTPSILLHSDVLAGIISEAFRDGALAELGEHPLCSPRELAQRSGRRK